MKIIIFMSCVVALTLQANTIYVNQAKHAKNADGQSWQTAYKNLNKALKTAKSGDDIWVAKGEYILKPTRLNGINIYGGFSANETELSQREIVNNETKLFGRLALQNALLSSVTILEAPENKPWRLRSNVSGEAASKYRMVEINFNEQQKSRGFKPDRKRLQDERERRYQRDLTDAKNTLAPVYEEEELQGLQSEPPYKAKDSRDTKVNERVQNNERQRHGPPQAKEVIQRFDTNADGKISQSEAPDKMKSDWDRLDTNKDGYVEENEMKPPHPRQGGQRLPHQERR